MRAPTYDDAARIKRARDYASHLAGLTDLHGKRVLEIGPYMGDFARILVEEYGCSVVGIDPMAHPNWPEVMASHPAIRLIQGDIAAPPDTLEAASFDLIASFVVFEHIRHPWSALSQCQRLLKPTGKNFIRANLYRSSIASHLYGRRKDPWPHLMYSPAELQAQLGLRELGWAFWVNKLTYQQYLFYFRQLGFFVTHEKLTQAHFSRDYYDAHEQKLGLYPEWDLRTDFFEVLLEFDPDHPKQPIADPVYARMAKPG